MYVYVAGAFTAPTAEGITANCAAAIAAGDAIAAAGHTPFIPHLFRAWDERHPHGYEFWMLQCFARVKCCDALVRLPGASSGADREVALAHERGIPVFHSVADFLRCG